MTNRQAPELAFAEALRAILASNGSAQLEYVSAQLQPFSNQQRPDIVFIPKSGGYSSQVIFLEIKLSTRGLQGGTDYRILVENMEFAAESLDSSISQYIYVTSSEVPEFSKRFVSERGIRILDLVTSPEQVIEGLKAMSIIP
jgi:hypothetical protein